MPTYAYAHAHMPALPGRAETVYYHPCLVDIYEVDDEDNAVVVHLPDFDVVSMLSESSSAMSSPSYGSDSSGGFRSRLNAADASDSGKKGTGKLVKADKRAGVQHGLGLQFTSGEGSQVKRMVYAKDDMVVARGADVASPSGLRKLLGLRRRRSGNDLRR
jgi:hypothetical protein